MMKHKILLLNILLIVTSSVLADVVFKASAPRTVAVGQQFRLSYTLNDKGKDIRIPEINGFEIKFGPEVSRGSSVRITGSQVETEVTETYTYILQAKEEGNFEIGSATITVNNSSYQSNSLTIKVIPADKTNQAVAQNRQEESAVSPEIGADDVFLRAHVAKNTVYENEGFLITYKFYFRVNISPASNLSPDFDGFISQTLDASANAPVNVETYNGKTYRTAVYQQYYLFPQKTGTITIPSAKMDIEATVLVRRARSFFENDQYANIRKTLQTNPLTINVKPLPVGKPTSFSGAVGDYKITSSITSENVKTNEGITIKWNISGSGNLKMIKNPEYIFPNDFEIYDPKVDLNIKTTQGGVSGSKSIEYLIIPRYAGDFVIPPVEFSYFDLKTGTYKKYQTQEYKLHVEKGKEGEGGTSQQVVNYSNKEDLKYLGKDIRYIKTNHFAFNSKRDFFFGSVLYILFYIFPTLIFVIFFIIYRKQVKENANIAFVRNKKANKVASKRLKIAEKLLKENKREAFYDEILRVLWGYLSDKLNIPVAFLTKDNIEVELSKYGVNDSLIKDLMDILNICEFARYAPVQGSGEMDKLYISTVQAIDNMENTIRKK